MCSREDADLVLAYNERDCDLLVSRMRRYKMDTTIVSACACCSAACPDVCNWNTGIMVISAYVAHAARRSTLVVWRSSSLCPDSYGEAMVYCSRPSISTNVIAQDNTSLYPNIMLSMNVSLECQ